MRRRVLSADPFSILRQDKAGTGFAGEKRKEKIKNQ
jgi:hypothetical protein